MVHLKSYSQEFQIKDGSTAKIDSVNSNINDIHRFVVSLKLSNIEGPKYVSLNYYQPKVFYVNLQYGEKTYVGDMNLFLKSWKIKGRLKSTIHTQPLYGNKYIRYKAKLPVNELLSLGLHFGGGFKSNPFQATDLISNYYFLGCTLLNSTSIKFRTNRGLNYSRRLVNRLNFDIVNYYNPQFKSNLYENYYPGADPKSFTRKFGYRLYYDGNVSIFPFREKEGRFTINYMFGVGIPMSLEKQINVLLGLGIGFTIF